MVWQRRERAPAPPFAAAFRDSPMGYTLGAGGRLPKARRGRVFRTTHHHHHSATAPWTTPVPQMPPPFERACALSSERAESRVELAPFPHAPRRSIARASIATHNTAAIRARLARAGRSSCSRALVRRPDARPRRVLAHPPSLSLSLSRSLSLYLSLSLSLSLSRRRAAASSRSPRARAAAAV